MQNSWLENTIFPWLSGHGIAILVIFAVAYIVNRFSRSVITRIVRKLVPPQGHLSPSAEAKRESTLIAIFGGAFRVIVWLVAGLMILSEMHLDIGPLLAGAGVAGVAFGFGAQYLVRDVINGLFIVLENQFRVGDVVQFGPVSGTIENITLRTTVLRDMDGVVHHVPNGEIKIASNMTKDFSRVNLDIGVAYESDLEKVIEVINKIGQDMASEDAWKNKIKKAPEFLRVNNLGDSSVDIKIVGEVLPLEQWAVTGELRKRLKIAFDKEGIEIPYPQQVVRNIK